jgi:hypothetical protein
MSCVTCWSSRSSACVSTSTATRGVVLVRVEVASWEEELLQRFAYGLSASLTWGTEQPSPGRSARSNCAFDTSIPTNTGAFEMPASLGGPSLHDAGSGPRNCSGSFRTMACRPMLPHDFSKPRSRRSITRRLT